MLDHQHIETSLHCCLHWFIFTTSHIYLLRLPRMHSGINVDILHFYNIRFQQHGRACGCYLININQMPNSIYTCSRPHLHSGTYYEVYNIQYTRGEYYCWYFLEYSIYVLYSLNCASHFHIGGIAATRATSFSDVASKYPRQKVPER